MAQPTPFEITTDFSEEEGNGVGGRSTVRTSALDGLFTGVKSTLDQVLENLAVLQRDDLALNDSLVTIASLSAEVRALLASTAWVVRGAWVTTTAYAKGDLVLQGGIVYLCMVAHTSGTFATDLAAGKWGQVTANATAATTTFAPTATRPEGNVQAAIQGLDDEVTALAAITGASLIGFLNDQGDTTTVNDELLRLGAVLSTFLASPAFEAPFNDAGAGAVTTTPSVGAGAASFTRATAAGTRNNSATLVIASAGTARSYYDAAGLYRGYLAEALDINLYTRPEDLGHADWATGGTGTITADSIAAPDGNVTADTGTPTAATFLKSQVKAIASGALHVNSGFFKKKDADEWCMLFASDNVSAGVRAWFNLATGVPGSIVPFGAGWTGSYAQMEDWGGGWYRCSFLVKPVGTTLVGGFNPSVRGDTDILSNIGRANYAWGMKLAARDEAATYKPAETVSFTRNGDVLSYQTSGNLSASSSTVYMEFSPYVEPQGDFFLWGSFVNASNYTAILHDGVNLIMRKRIGGTNFDATLAAGFSPGNSYKIAGTWGSRGVHIAMDGVEGISHANTTSAQIGAAMQWGADGNGLFQAGGAIKEARTWTAQL